MRLATIDLDWLENQIHIENKVQKQYKKENNFEYLLMSISIRNTLLEIKSKCTIIEQQKTDSNE